MQDAYEAEDEIDDAADNAAEAQQKRSRAAAIASGGSLPDTSAYFHERLYWGTCTSRSSAINDKIAPLLPSKSLIAHIPITGTLRGTACAARVAAHTQNLVTAKHQE